jgi:flagellar basal body-associated protein FliL
MKKKNWLLIIIILVAVLLIATVMWIYAKRIENIESKMKISAISTDGKLLLHIWANAREKIISASFC